MTHIGWPQSIVIALMILQLVIGATADGTPRTGTNKFPVSFVSVILNAGLLYWGGFFG